MERLKLPGSLPLIDMPKPVTRKQIALKFFLIGTEVISGTGALVFLLGGQPIMALGWATLGSSLAGGDYLTTGMLRTDRILEDAKQRVDRNLAESKAILERIKKRSGL